MNKIKKWLDKLKFMFFSLHLNYTSLILADHFLSNEILTKKVILKLSYKVSLDKLCKRKRVSLAIAVKSA